MYVYAISSMAKYGAHWATVRVSSHELSEDQIQASGRVEPPGWSLIPNGLFRPEDVVSVVHALEVT